MILYSTSSIMYIDAIFTKTTKLLHWRGGKTHISRVLYSRNCQAEDSFPSLSRRTWPRLSPLTSIHVWFISSWICCNSASTVSSSFRNSCKSSEKDALTRNLSVQHWNQALLLPITELDNSFITWCRPCNVFPNAAFSSPLESFFSSLLVLFGTRYINDSINTGSCLSKNKCNLYMDSNAFVVPPLASYLNSSVEEWRLRNGKWWYENVWGL